MAANQKEPLGNFEHGALIGGTQDRKLDRMNCISFINGHGVLRKQHQIHLLSRLAAGIILVLAGGCTTENRYGEKAVSPGDFAGKTSSGATAWIGQRNSWIIPNQTVIAAEKEKPGSTAEEQPAAGDLQQKQAEAAYASTVGNKAQVTETMLGKENQGKTAETSTNEASENNQAPATGTGKILKLDGMVGQVNGQAIYAGKVLEPLEAELTKLGQKFPAAVFRKEATKAIAVRLDDMVFNQLVLGEAERDLSEQEQQGLQNMLKQRREELILRWGAGSAMVAETKLKEKEGKGLDEKMRELREKTVVQRYLSIKLLPKINVTRKDIERYYRDNADRYQPQPGRTIRLIRTEEGTGAKEIEKLMSEGKTFHEAAESKWNRYRKEQAGLFGEKITGDRVFGMEALNEALLKLKPGEMSPRIEIEKATYWVYLESQETAVHIPLSQAQQEIEETLRKQRFQQLTAAYRRQLFEKGSYRSLDEMLSALLDVATARYAKVIP